MSTTRARWTALLLVLVVMLAAAFAVVCPPGSAQAGSRDRADLKAASGAVTAAGGVLTGRVTVKNGGLRNAEASTVAVSVLAPGGVVRAGVVALRKLKPGRKVTLGISLPVPAVSCADAGGSVRERSESNNCRVVGSYTAPAPAPAAPAAPAPTSSVPTNPFTAYTKGDVFTLDSGTTNWVFVPESYDATNPGGSQSWISMAVGGRG